MDSFWIRINRLKKRVHEEGLFHALAQTASNQQQVLAGKMKRYLGNREIIRQINQLMASASTVTEAEALALVDRLDRMEKMPFSQKTVFDIQYDLMIVVPVYNTEKYLEECITSILNQKTEYRVLTVFVNDGSPDGCDEILQRYEDRPNVKVIRQENRGFSGARNRALETMYGEYVMFVDSDDLLAEGAVQKLMEVAFRKKADLVEGGYVKFGEGMEDVTLTRDYDGPTKADQRMLMGFPWMKVIRSDLLKDLCFPQRIWFEDTIMQELLYPMCGNPWVIPDIVYRYRQNPDGISATARTKDKSLDTWWITKFCLEEKVQRGQPIDEYERELFFIQLKRNSRRLGSMPEEVQEAVFVLSCGLYEQYFAELPDPKGILFSALDRTLNNRSWKAYRYITENWDALQ